MSPRFRNSGLLAILTAASVFALAGGADAAAITWTGGVNANWDINTTANWTGDTTVYSEGDAVTFDGTSANPDAVTLTTTLNPGSVTVDADRDYTFAGAGKLAGATGITKSGNGILTLNNSNTFSGAVNVNAGTVLLGHLNALGATTGGTFVNNGGTLDLYGKVVPAAETITVAAGGTVINTYDALAQIDKLVLTGNATFGGSQRLEIRGTPSFGNHTLTVNHTGNGIPGDYDAVRLTGTPSWLTHDLRDANVVQGALAFHNAKLGQADGTITVTHNPTATYPSTLFLMKTIETSGTLVNTDLYKNLVFTGGRLYDYRGRYTLHGSTTLNDMATEVFVNTPGSYNTSIIFADAITGDGGITKTGTGSLTLEAANAYTGNTTVSAGSLILGASGSVSNSAVINVEASGTLNVASVTGGFTVANGQTLMGGGTVTGSVTAAIGSELAPGASVGSLNVNGNLALDGTLAVEYDGATIDLLAVAGNLDLDGGLFSFSQFGAALTEESYTFLTYTGTRTGTAGGAAPAGYHVEYDDVAKTVSLAIPEPSTFVLMILGLACLAAPARRRS